MNQPLLQHQISTADEGAAVVRAVVRDVPGDPLRLELRSNAATAAADLDNAEAVRIANALLCAVSLRMGRQPGTPLPDPKQERFAMLRASGCNQLEAYVATGHRPDQSSSSKWERRYPLIRIRTAEIRAAMAATASLCSSST